MNAFALPSKDVFVYTGLLDVLPDDNAMLAAVLAHEVAHVVERHSVENLGVSPYYTPAKMLMTVPKRRCRCIRCPPRNIFRPHHLLPPHHRHSWSFHQLAQRCRSYPGIFP
jgi:hypothetical protein